MNSNNANFSNSSQNLCYYPEQPKEPEKKQDTTFNINNLGNLMHLINMFKGSEKLDFSTLLSSPIGKSFGIDENAAMMLKMLSSNMKKVETKSAKASLPSIDSLERIN